MNILQRYFLNFMILVTALLLLPTMAMASSDLMLKNDMPLNIAAIYGIDSSGTTLPKLAGSLAKDSSLMINADKLPMHKYTRIVVLMDNGMGWQFYPEESLKKIEGILFSMNATDPNGEHAFPVMSIGLSEGQILEYPAGIPMNQVEQLLTQNKQEGDWKTLAMPKVNELKTPDAFAIAFAMQSWDLAGAGIQYKKHASNQHYVTSITLTAPFDPIALGAIFDELKTSGYTPWLTVWKSKTTILAKEGVALASGAHGISKASDDEEKWEAIKEVLIANLNTQEKNVRFALGTKALCCDITLDYDAAKAILTISRRAN